MDLYSHKLIDECFAWVCRHAELRPVPGSVDPSHRYIIRSGLQKAIRRGQVDRATDLALRLYRIDPTYIWTSMVTVAVEDIGAGNPDAVLWATMAQAATFRRAVGEVPLLIALARSMAASTKCRLACEIPYVTDQSRHNLFRTMGRYSMTDLFARASGDDPVEAYVSLAILRGKTPAGLRLRAPNRSEFGDVCELFSDLLPGSYARAAKAAFLRPLDEMSVAILSSFRVHCRADDTIHHDSCPESFQIEGYASEAYDQHERTGRRALVAFTNHLTEVSPAMASIPARVRKQVVMDGVFVVEGQCADIRWSGDERGAYRLAFDDFMLFRHGISTDQARSVRSSVETEIPSLNDHRVRAARSASLS